MKYGEFEAEFKKHHICGVPFIPYELAYSSDCPKCEPKLEQWKETCKDYYTRGQTNFINGLWQYKV